MLKHLPHESAVQKSAWKCLPALQMTAPVCSVLISEAQACFAYDPRQVRPRVALGKGLAARLEWHRS